MEEKCEKVNKNERNDKFRPIRIGRISLKSVNRFVLHIILLNVQYRCLFSYFSILSTNSIIFFLFLSFSLSLVFQPILTYTDDWERTTVGKNDRKVKFFTSKSGDRILIIDQYRYFKNSEDKMLTKWKCHEFFKSKCPAAVATTKEDDPRVVVMNDVHIHSRKRSANKER